MSIKNYFILSLFVSMAFASCKKESAGDGVFDAPYAALSDEENKSNLEDAGVEMLDEMEAMMDVPAADVSIQFSKHSENLMDGNSASFYASPLNSLSLLKSGKSGAKDVLVGLKSITEDPETITEAWDMIVGTYAWNAVSEEWDFTAGGNSIIIKFPGMEGDITNTAVYTVSNFGYVAITEPATVFELDDIDFDLQLPTSLNASLTYKGDEVASYVLSASYQSDGIPTSISSKLTVEEFVFSAELTHTVNVAAGITYSMKHSSKTLIEYHMDAAGNWSEENIDNNTETVKEVYYTDENGKDYYDEWTEVYVENILTKANAYFQLLDIKVVAKVDFAPLGAAMRKLDEKYYGSESDYYNDSDDKAYMEDMADLYNKYIKLVVVYADNNTKIAQAGFYVFEENDAYYGYTNTYLDVNFVFSDGSIVDAETYFSNGFGGLETQINDFIKSIEQDYSVDMDPVDFSD